MIGSDLRHALDKVLEIVERGDGGRRSALQLGYNLGRVAELAGLGREAVWDRWKGPATDWDRPTLRDLARDLLSRIDPDARPDGTS